MTKARVLLVNPPIYDFTAYDFWLRPYGMLRAAGRLRHACEYRTFDFLWSRPRDGWGRGRFLEAMAPKPVEYRDIPRRFRRFGRPRQEFREFLRRETFDVALIQSMMTYWYPGIREVIDDLRALQPHARIVLGGFYATICRGHARGLGADLVVAGADIEPLCRLLGARPSEGPAYWEGSVRGVGVIKLSEGCPFRCSYCSAPLLNPEFRRRPVEACVEEIRELAALGARDVAFYDDALLFRAGECLLPFLDEVEREGVTVRFHTPNALNARFVTADLARRMVSAGFRSFFLGLESASGSWQDGTGGKVSNEEFRSAVRFLKEAGAEHVAAYVLMGHPGAEPEEIEQSMRFAGEQGARVILSEFAPVPGTPDGERCRPWADLEEPLAHNKTAFAIRRLGVETVNRLKDLCRRLNSRTGG